MAEEESEQKTENPSRVPMKIIGYEDVDPSTLAAHPQNWRVHPQHQNEAMLGVMREVGWIDPVTVNKNTGVVVDGHMRVALAIRNGIDKVPVVYVDLTEDEERKALITFNTVSDMGKTDPDMLSDLLDGVDWQDAAAGELADAIADSISRELNPEAEGEENGMTGGDEDCEFPISPKLGEKYDYALIYTTNEIDYTYLCTALGLVKEQSYKSSAVGHGRVVPFEKFRQLWEARRSGG
ncbi:MAG TPA: ParB N-terminal domain-containing protein [Phycisphaerae bacterium]|nr:ParB N-terminal domain-containing protein [Phycisphaerae bacterium]HRY69068.1 ParB N-terminal domain-containing protein [Phycisphaerae bacterium]HSA25957.1 ParB N-terminal domain-containing protein [Phycisphaerae bacterium]